VNGRQARRVLPLIFLVLGTVIAWSVDGDPGFHQVLPSRGHDLQVHELHVFQSADHSLLLWRARLSGRANLGVAPGGLRAFDRRGYEHLWWLLLASTIFGWSNVAYEFWTWSQSATRTIVSCSAQPLSSPLQSPCLYGSTMFLGAWLSVDLIVRARRQP